MTARRPELHVIHAGNMQPGDWYAATVNPSAPYRPVGDFAAAFHIASVEKFTDGQGRPMVQPHAVTGLDPGPVGIATQVIVIRGAG